MRTDVLPASDAIARLRRSQRLLIIGVVVRAVAIGAVVAIVTLGLAMLIDAVAGIPRDIRQVVVPLALVLATAVAATTAWRNRYALSTRHVARWIEEREPRLEYALLTTMEAAMPMAARPRIEAAVRAVRWEPIVSRRLARALALPVGAAVVLALLLLLSPSDSRARVTAPTPGDELARTGTGDDAADPLATIVAVITPPEYSGRRPVTLENPRTIGGLAGSSVLIQGRTGRGAVTAMLDVQPLVIATTPDRWTATFRLPARPTALRLGHERSERLIVIEPVADSIPVVALDQPTADTVFATPAGALAIAATLHDDIGIVSGGIEYIVSSGSGEAFTFRSGTLSPINGGGRTRVELSTRAMLDSLALAAGDIVHLRAFARDANTISGPSTGYSETRAIRIARADEHDSVAVEAAPPPEADASLVSQRMLIVLTEALEARRRRMTRADVIAESRRLAADQKRLRRTVGDIIFTRLGTQPDVEHVHGPGDTHAPGDLTPAEVLRAAERATVAGQNQALDFHGDESPVVAINRPLLEAYNHMWDASRELDIGEPARALPPMRAALAAIQRARQAERIYLRGRTAPVIVDVAAIRLQGKETGVGSARTGRIPLERRRELDRFTRAVDLLGGAPQQAIDSLLLLRVDLLTDRPAVASILGESIDILRAGRDATAALARARRALVGDPVSAPGLGRWSGGW